MSVLAVGDSITWGDNTAVGDLLCRSYARWVADALGVEGGVCGCGGRLCGSGGVVGGVGHQWLLGLNVGLVGDREADPRARHERGGGVVADDAVVRGVLRV